MTMNQKVARYAELKAMKKDIDAELADLLLDIDEELGSAEQDGRNFVKKFGKILFTWLPKSKEVISLKNLKLEQPGIYEDLRAKGYITVSNYIEHRTKEDK